MRALTLEETKCLFYKIVKYKKNSLLLFLERAKKNSIVFRIQKSRIFEAFLGIARQSESFQEHQIGSLGVCIARYTHSSRMLLMIPALKLMSEYPEANSIGVTQNGEKIFLQGHHLSHVFFTWINGQPLKNEGIQVVGPSGLILGFGEIVDKIQVHKITNRKKIAIVNHGDIGSYTRIF